MYLRNPIGRIKEKKKTFLVDWAKILDSLSFRLDKSLVAFTFLSM